MITIQDLQNRAAALSEQYMVGSVTPKDIGDLFNDFMSYVYTLQLNLSSLGIRKIYFSHEQMDADENPVAANGVRLKFGQLVAIASVGSDAGKIYAYTDPGWAFVGQISELTTILNEFTEVKSSLSTALEKLSTADTSIVNLKTVAQGLSNGLEELKITVDNSVTTMYSSTPPFFEVDASTGVEVFLESVTRGYDVVYLQSTNTFVARVGQKYYSNWAAKGGYPNGPSYGLVSLNGYIPVVGRLYLKGAELWMYNGSSLNKIN